MILIVGLGNPKKKYQGTRHNIGQEIVKTFVKNFDFPKFKSNKKLKTELSKKQDLILALPTTFMNESGLAIKKIITNKHLSSTNLWVIHDDIDLPLGKIRISKARSAAGHKGVESIINELGTKNFIRFRIGIGPQKGMSEKFVLKKFAKTERKTVNQVIDLTIQSISTALEKGIETAMNQYN